MTVIPTPHFVAEVLDLDDIPERREPDSDDRFCDGGINYAFEYDIGWKRPHCPDCDSSDVSMIVYGNPDLELIQQAGGRRLKLGGCCVTENDPEWHCWQCEREW